MRTLLAIPLVALCLTYGMPADATDYSRLLEPSYARVLLLPAKRAQQAECAGLAIHFAGTRPDFSKELAERISDAVTRRLSADLDDVKLARELVETKAQYHSNSGYGPEPKVEIINILERQCQPLFDEAAKGDAALDVALGPVPSKPIDLPDPGQCLAVVSLAAEGDAVDSAIDLKRFLQEGWIDQAPAAERASRQAKVATSISMLRSLALNSYQLNDMVFACIPTMKNFIPNTNERPAP